VKFFILVGSGLIGFAGGLYVSGHFLVEHISDWMSRVLDSEPTDHPQNIERAQYIWWAGGAIAVLPMAIVDGRFLIAFAGLLFGIVWKRLRPAVREIGRRYGQSREVARVATASFEVIRTGRVPRYLDYGRALVWLHRKALETVDPGARRELLEEMVYEHLLERNGTSYRVPTAIWGRIPELEPVIGALPEGRPF
jgi:hypothetical protein